MSKNTGITIVVVIILIIAAYFVFFRGPATPSSQPGASGQSQTAANAVILKNFAFSPASITVKAGDTVQWTNQDTAPHTVSSDNGAFDSETLNTGQTFKFTFSSPGTYAYHCSVHPSMTAKVIVQ